MDFPNILPARLCISDLHLQWPLMGSNGLHLSYCLHLYWSPSSNHKLHLLWPLMDFPNILVARVCISDLHLQWPLIGSNGLHLSYYLHLYWSSSSNCKLHLLWPPMDFPNILPARLCLSDIHLQRLPMGSNGLQLSYCLHLHWSPSSNHKLQFIWPPMDFPAILVARVYISLLHLQWLPMASKGLNLPGKGCL